MAALLIARRVATVGAGLGPPLVLAYSVEKEGGLAEKIADKGAALGDALHKLSSDARHTLGVEAAARFARSTFYGALVAADYKLTLSLSGLDVSSAEYRALQSEVHLRSAKRLLHVCQSHSGVYTKLGQFIASLVRVIPDEWTDTLRVLQDSNPGVDYRDVRRLFREEFGLPLEELFQHFEPQPLAAASLAQVHRAVTREGQVVAVKCQYPRLRNQIDSDTWTITQLSRLVSFLFKEYEFTWLIPEFEESLQLELDFHQEATNSERVSRLFEGDPRVHIPEVRWDLTTKRVLTMEFVQGAKVNSVPGLRSLGLNPKEVGDELSSIFSRMIFYCGFVHCDPHPGNLLVRRSPPPPPSAGWRAWCKYHVTGWLGLRPDLQLVVLDHGMYRRLGEGFRRSYGSLWKAFMTRDVALGRQATRELGIEPELFEVLSLISVNRTPTSNASLGDTMTTEERKALREKYRDRTKYGPEKVRELLSSLPRDVLFVLRTNALVRSINAELGTHSGTRFRIFGSSAVKGLSIPLSARPPEDAYFLSEIRDYSQRLPQKGRVIQKRTKAEILSHPHASVNQPTAAEAFLFGQERLPRLKEIRRQLLVADLRLRVWLVDAGIETASWLSNRWRETKALVGEQLVVEQLKVQVEEGEQQQQDGGGGDKDNKQGAAAAEAPAPDAAAVTK